MSWMMSSLTHGTVASTPRTIFLNFVIEIVASFKNFNSWFVNILWKWKFYGGGVITKRVFSKEIKEVNLLQSILKEV